MKQDYQECFQSEAETLGLILSCWQMLKVLQQWLEGDLRPP